MPLSAGTRLGPYEILSPLGAAGMGEVYRAHDTKLNRDVALKILPDAFASDPDRLARPSHSGWWGGRSPGTRRCRSRSRSPRRSKPRTSGGSFIGISNPPT